MALEERGCDAPFAAEPGSFRLAVSTILSLFSPFVESARLRRADLSTGLGLNAPPVGKSGWLVYSFALFTPRKRRIQ